MQIKGTKYSKGSVTIIEAAVIPMFGLIVDLLVVDIDVRLYLKFLLQNILRNTFMHSKFPKKPLFH